MARILRYCRRGLLSFALSACFTPATLFGQIPWTNDYSAAASASQSTGAVMLLHFYSDDCVPCKMLDARAFQDPQLITAVKQTVIPVKVNVDRFPQIAKQYSVTRWPTDVYIAGDGTELARSISPQKTSDYLALLERVSLRNRDHIVVKQGQSVAQSYPSPHCEQALPSSPQPSAVFQPQLSVPNATVAATLQAKPNSNVFEPIYPATPQTPTNVNTLGASMFAPVNAPNPAFVTSNTPQANAASQPPALQQVPQSPTSVANVPDNNFDRVIQPSSQSVVVNQFLLPQAASAGSTMEPIQSTAATQQFPSAASNQPILQQSPGVNTSFVSSSQTVASPAAQPAPVPQAKLVSTPSVAIEPEHDAMVKAKIASEVQRALSSDSGPAIAGYCPVTLDEEGEWTQGRKQYAVRHRGRVYYLASKERQARFLEAPDRYAPVLSGYDLVHFLHTGTLREGLREFGCWYKGRVYLFSNEANRTYFDENVINLAATAEALQSGTNRSDNQQSSPDTSGGRIADGMQPGTLSR